MLSLVHKVSLIVATILAVAGARPVNAATPSDAPDVAPQAPAQTEAEPPAAATDIDQRDDAPLGQWVFTEQYGWVWIPYADSYTYAPPGGWGTPYEYVYGPTFGWEWVVAPWVWGWGPWPFFGEIGPLQFGWYGRGWWRTPGRWHWRDPDGWHGPGRWGHLRGAPLNRGGPGLSSWPARPPPTSPDFRSGPSRGGYSAPGVARPGGDRPEPMHGGSFHGGGLQSGSGGSWHGGR